MTPDDLERLDGLIAEAQRRTEVHAQSHAESLRTEDPGDIFNADEDREERDDAINLAVDFWRGFGKPADRRDEVMALPGAERWLTMLQEDPASTEAFRELTDDATSWRPVDLAQVEAGEDVAPPTLLRRTDGPALLYSGAVNWIQGPPESMKTLLVQFGIVDVASRGGRVLYIDFEDTERTLLARLQALGLTMQQIVASVTYLRPQDPLMVRDTPTQALLDLQDVIDAGPYELAVIDGVTEALTVEGLSLLDNTDIAAWLRLLPRRLADAGAAVAPIDHVTKSPENRGRYALGAQHKLAGVSGAAYSLRVVQPLGRATGSTEVHGAVAIEVVKDRPGHVRASAKGSTVAILSATAYPDGGLSLSLEPPGADSITPDMTMVLEILEHLVTYPGDSANAVVRAVTGKDEDIRRALKWMSDSERCWVKVEKKGQSHAHSLTPAGRQELGR